MKEKKFSKKHKKYVTWFKEVSKVLESLLNNRLVFSKKLELLDFGFFEIFEELTSGNTVAIAGDSYSITLAINPDDDELFIKSIMAHELAHLLFSATNLLIMSDYCSTDDSFSLTYVQRKISDSVDTYGSALEEMLCDYISVEILYKHFEGKYTREEIVDNIYSETITGFTRENYNIVSKIVNLFGKELKECEKIDSYSSNGNYDRPDNLLLYTAVTGSMALLVNDYDECMGHGAWQQLNKAFDKYALDNSNDELKEFIDNELNRFE